MESKSNIKEEVEEEEDNEVQFAAYHISSTLTECVSEIESEPPYSATFRKPIYTPSNELTGPLWMVNFLVDFWEYPDKEKLRAEHKEDLLLYYPENSIKDVEKDCFTLKTVEIPPVLKMKRKVYVEESDSDSGSSGDLHIDAKTDSGKKLDDKDKDKCPERLIEEKGEILRKKESDRSNIVDTEQNSMKNKIRERSKKIKKFNLSGYKNLFQICKKTAEREFEKRKAATEQHKAKKDEHSKSSQLDAQLNNNLPLEREDGKITKHKHDKKCHGSKSDNYVPKKIEKSQKKSEKRSHSSSKSRKRDSTDSGYDYRIKSRKSNVSPRSCAETPKKIAEKSKRTAEMPNTPAKIAKKSSDSDKLSSDSEKSYRNKSNSSVRKENSKNIVNDYSSLDTIERIMSDLIDDPILEEQDKACDTAKSLPNEQIIEVNNAVIPEVPVLEEKNEENVDKLVIKKEVKNECIAEVLEISNEIVLDCDIIMLDSSPMKRSNESVLKVANKRIKKTLSKAQENIQNIVSSFNDILNFQNMVYELDRAKSKHHVFANNMFNEWITRNGNNLINNYKNFKLMCNADSDPLEELEKISKIPKNELSFMLKICEKNNSDSEFNVPARNIYLLPPPIVYLLENIPKLSPELTEEAIKQYELSKAFLSPALPCIKKLDSHFTNTKLNSPQPIKSNTECPGIDGSLRQLSDISVGVLNFSNNANNNNVSNLPLLSPRNRPILSIPTLSPRPQIVESQYPINDTTVTLVNETNRSLNPTPPSLSTRTQISQTQSISSAEISSSNLNPDSRTTLTTLTQPSSSCAQDNTLPVLNSDAMSLLSQLVDSTYNSDEQTAILQKAQNEAQRIQAEAAASLIVHNTVEKLPVNTSQRSSNASSIIMNRLNGNFNPGYQHSQIPSKKVDATGSGVQIRHSENRISNNNKRPSESVPFYSRPRKSPTAPHSAIIATIPRNLSLPTISVSPDNAQIGGNATLPQNYPKNVYPPRIPLINNVHVAGNATLQQNSLPHMEEMLAETYGAASLNCGSSFSSGPTHVTPITENNNQSTRRTALPHNYKAPTRINPIVDYNIRRLSTLSDNSRYTQRPLYPVPNSITDGLEKNTNASYSSSVGLLNQHQRIDNCAIPSRVNFPDQVNNDGDTSQNYHARRINNNRYEIVPLPPQTPPNYGNLRMCSNQNVPYGVSNKELNQPIPRISDVRTLGDPRRENRISNNLTLPSYNHGMGQRNTATNAEFSSVSNDPPRLMVRRDITDQIRQNHPPQDQTRQLSMMNNLQNNTWHTQQKNN